MIHYEWFGPQGQRRSKVIDEKDAAVQIGQRALIGFHLVQRYVPTPANTPDVSLVYFQSDITGKVWSLYYDV